MKKYDSIIFDLDGTLWDATEASAIGWNKALAKVNFHKYIITARTIKDICGLPFDECVSYVFGNDDQIDCELIEPIIDEEEKKSLELLGGPVFEDVISGIEQLSRKYKIFLVSNCQSWYLELFWKQYRKKKHFHDSDCYGDSGVSKCQMIRNTAIKHSLKNPIYIGDTEGDMISSHNANVAFGFAKYGFGKIKNPKLSFGEFSDTIKYFL